MTRRYVRVLDDGRVAIPTSIEFLLTIDELAAGVISACTKHGPSGRRFTGRLRHHAQTGESYWPVRSKVEVDRRLRWLALLDRAQR